MTDWYLKSIETEIHSAEASAAVIRARLKPLFGKQSRRMTLLGHMVGRVMQNCELNCDTPIIYATTYSETLTIEKYLESFPTPSPTQFQTSIHPSAVEQIAIHQKQAIAQFFPLAGSPELIALQAIRTALNLAKENVFIVFGEEQGTWLNELGVASPYSFAALLHLTTSPEGSLAKLTYEPEARTENSYALSVYEIVSQCAQRQDCRFGHPDCGCVTLRWQRP